MDGWMDRRWMVDAWGMGASQVTSSAAAVRFFIVSHKMPRIPEDCKYLEVFRSGKRVGAEVLSRTAHSGAWGSRRWLFSNVRSASWKESLDVRLEGTVYNKNLK